MSRVNRRPRLYTWVKRWLWNFRYNWREHAINATLALIFVGFLVTLWLSADYIGGLSIDLGVKVSSILLTVQGILLGFTVLMKDSRIKAMIMFTGILGLILSTTSIIDGNFFLMQSPIPSPSHPVLTVAGYNITYTDLFGGSVVLFVGTLSGYVADVMTMFSTQPEEEEFKMPSMAEQNEDWSD